VFLLIYAELSTISRLRIPVSVAKIISWSEVVNLKAEGEVCPLTKNSLSVRRRSSYSSIFRSSNCQAHPRFIVEFYSICWP
jgi:hypothetical protein